MRDDDQELSDVLGSALASAHENSGAISFPDGCIASVATGLEDLWGAKPLRSDEHPYDALVRIAGEDNACDLNFNPDRSRYPDLLAHPESFRWFLSWKWTTYVQQIIFLFSLARLLPRDISALDVGCGNGVHSILLSTMTDIDVKGIDACNNAVEYAKSKCQGLRRVSFQTLDISKDPPPGSFEFVFALGVSEYVGLDHLLKWNRQAVSDFGVTVVETNCSVLPCDVLADSGFDHVFTYYPKQDRDSGETVFFLHVLTAIRA